jgi:type IV pilus assembly protein PilV
MHMTDHLHKGFSLIEVLVTIVILVIGLLGLAGLQSRALTAQMESYQRSQALVLLQDMAGRINDNRANAANYVTATPLGTGNTSYASCTTSNTGSVADDKCEWNNALLGAAETSSTSKNVGAMIGARGCVLQVTAAASGVPGQYLVAVAWQGLNPTKAPSVSCGAGSYGTNDALRRAISLPITIAILQ